MLLYGGSGHAKVVLDCLQAQRVVVTGIFDDNPNLKQLLHVPVIGAYRAETRADEPLVIAIGDNGIRRRVAGLVRHSFGRAVHPSALVSGLETQVGVGTVIFHQAVVQASTKIGNHCIVNTAAVVEHDCTVADFVHVSPHATLCGGVTVGEGTHIGAGATVIPGIRIGRWCVVGAGSVVVRDLPDLAVAVGVPAKVIRERDEE
ncbi:MAG: acetyltransferase [Cytophagales bacterium]|jgi:sugar O-acyltransferase (sialic acid O-acetyltransferase NeuD family)|nr:acetyltransferase [Cytophagales bacterium]